MKPNPDAPINLPEIDILFQSITQSIRCRMVRGYADRFHKGTEPGRGWFVSTRSR